MVAAAGMVAGLGGIAYYSTAEVQRKFELASATGPLVRMLDAETAHKAAIWLARAGLFPRETRPDPQSLKVKLWGKQFPNPIGACFVFGRDKAAEPSESSDAIISYAPGWTGEGHWIQQTVMPTKKA